MIDYRHLQEAMRKAPTDPATYAPLGDELAEAAHQAALGSQDAAERVERALLGTEHSVTATARGDGPPSRQRLEAIIETIITKEPHHG